MYLRFMAVYVCIELYVLLPLWRNKKRNNYLSVSQGGFEPYYRSQH